MKNGNDRIAKGAPSDEEKGGGDFRILGKVEDEEGKEHGRDAIFQSVQGSFRIGEFSSTNISKGDGEAKEDEKRRDPILAKASELTQDGCDVSVGDEGSAKTEDGDGVGDEHFGIEENGVLLEEMAWGYAVNLGGDEKENGEKAEKTKESRGVKGDAPGEVGGEKGP